MINNKIQIGQILGAHGIHGELKIRPLTEDPNRFYSLNSVFLVKNDILLEYNIKSTRLHQDKVLLTLTGIEDRNTAEKYIGYLLYIPRENSIELSDDEYFICDLIGMKVITNAGVNVGIITDILQNTGSTDVLEIKLDRKKIYVPFRKIFFPKISLNEKVVFSDIPEDYMNL